MDRIMEQNQIQLNEHNKQEFPPMHTAEHLLNGEMARRYGCGRAFTAHLERKKSKLDYHLPEPLSDSDIADLELYVRHAIEADVEVWDEYITQDEARSRFDLSRLPEGASDTVRVVHVGDFDQCLCAGLHVHRTSEILDFRITSTRWQDGVQRIVFRCN